MFDYNLAVRKVPDFPKKGILFYDITSLVANPKALSAIKADMINLYKDKGITKIIGVESRGFLFATLLGEALQIPVILARKKGKLPNVTFRAEYQLEYGTDAIEIQQLDLKDDDTHLIVDDLVATGGTLDAVRRLVEGHSKGKVKYVFCVIGLPFLNYDKVLQGMEVSTLIQYHGE